MAKQKGTIRLKGTLDGINYYSSAGMDLARRAGGGYTSDKVLNSDSMVRVRENASEFGRCSMLKKKFRLSLSPYLCLRKDGSLHRRMMTLFTELKTMDKINVRGERKVARGIETEKGRSLFMEFPFMPNFHAKATLAASLDFDLATRILQVSSFDVRSVRFPTGATHMALSLAHLNFDFDTGESRLKMGTPHYIDRSYGPDEFQLAVDDVEGTGVGMVFLAIKFYQEVQNKFYLLRANNAIGLELLDMT